MTFLVALEFMAGEGGWKRRKGARGRVEGIQRALHTGLKALGKGKLSAGEFEEVDVSQLVLKAAGEELLELGSFDVWKLSKDLQKEASDSFVRGIGAGLLSGSDLLFRREGRTTTPSTYVEITSSSELSCWTSV